MSHNQIPYTSQSNPRYTGHTNSSYNSVPSKSLLCFNSVHSSFNGGSSMLYPKSQNPNKIKKIASRNTWNHTFSIPMNCGKPICYDNPELELWSHTHNIKLKTGNRRIICGGLLWNIYIHPNQGEHSNEFALSVFPIKHNIFDTIPHNYKLNYAVSCALINNAIDTDEKSNKPNNAGFDYEFNRTIDNIENDMDNDGYTFPNKQRLLFSIADLIEHNCVDNDNDYFNLLIGIRTSFMRIENKRSLYTGVVGAILLQTEEEILKMRQEMEALKGNKDRYIVHLETELRDLKGLNHKMQENMHSFTEFHQTYITQLQDLKNDFANVSMTKEKNITLLQNDIIHKNNEISQLQTQMNTLQIQMQHNHSQHSNNNMQQILQLLQTQQPIQPMPPMHNMSMPPNNNNMQNGVSMPPVQHQQRMQFEQQLREQQNIEQNLNLSQNNPFSSSIHNESHSVARVITQPPYETYHTQTQTQAQVQTHVQTEIAASMPRLEENKEEKSGMITDEIETMDVLDFEHREVRAWRYDNEQKKWRSRGSGKLQIFENKQTGTAKMVFTDEKHEKTRLLQYINGTDLCTYSEEAKNSIEWVGSDYTMDQNQPMNGKWKVCFFENESVAKQFMDAFNGFIHKCNGTTADESSEVKPFSFVHNDTAEHETFGNERIEFGQANTDWASAFHTGNTEANDSNNGNDGNDANETSSFGQINFSFHNKSSENSNSNENLNVSKEALETEDNGLENTFAPIVELEEQRVDTGHENEALLVEIDFFKLYRFGKDVTQIPVWKTRACKSKVGFYQSNENGKIRIVAREQETNKLRMNQFVPNSDSSSFQLKQSNVYSWSAYDVSVANEEPNENVGLTTWSIKFQNDTDSELFKEHFTKAMENNTEINKERNKDNVSANETNDNSNNWGNINAFGDNNANVASKDANVAPKDANDGNNNWFGNNSTEANDTNPTSKSWFGDNPSTEAPNRGSNNWSNSFDSNSFNKSFESNHSNTEDKYKGWAAEEIEADKLRIEKAKESEKQAQLFLNNDTNKTEPKQWNMNAFEAPKEDNVENMFTNFNFEDSRGVDLEAERELEKMREKEKSQTSSFSVNDGNKNEIAAMFDNDGNKNETDTTEVKNTETVAIEKKTDQKQETTVEDTTENPSANWGDISGGFSSVKTQKGFANSTWGNDGNNDGFGTFGDTAAEFDFNTLISENKREDKRDDSTTPAQKQEDIGSAGNDVEDNGTYNLKPIVSLAEVEVESGHENEERLREFEIIKLYRFGKDVSSVPCWKNRASKTKLSFFQDKQSGKIRLVCRENITNKLRMNQWIADLASANLQVKAQSPKQVQWSAFDSTIAEEDDDGGQSKGFCMFAAKFAEESVAKEFHEFYTTSSQNNQHV